MDEKQESLLIDCLDALEQGASLEQTLASHPADAPWLRPLLQTALALSTGKSKPSPAAEQASRQAFLKQAAQLAQKRDNGKIRD